MTRDELIECHPKLQARKVWCRTCRREQRVENGFRDGWPKCCNYTMTIDPLSEWPALSSNPESTEG